MKARLGADRDQERDQDRGAISLFVAVSVLSLILLLGLVVDGGGRMRTQSRADALAQEAARAAGQAVDPAYAVPGTAYVVDAASLGQARQAASDYLAGSGAQLVSVQPTADGTQVEVTVTLDFHTTVAAFFGVDTLTVTGHGSAGLVVGVQAPGQ